MSKPDLTFGELRELLLRLGFREAPDDPKRIRFSRNGISIAAAYLS
jgi:hypothetical protein